MSSIVPSVTQAFAIMRTLRDGSSRSLTEVAQRCAISPSSCLALLRTLVAEGVLRPETGKRYTLAPAWAAAMAGDAERLAQMIARAQPQLARMARAWGAPVGLWHVVSRNRLQLAAFGQSAEATRLHMEVGQRQPIGSGAVGRALAAAQRLAEDEVARRFAAVRWQSPLTLDDYKAQIAEAEADGYAVDHGLANRGILSIAAIVPDAAATFCLSVSVFDGTLAPDAMASLAAALRTVAGDLAAPAQADEATGREALR